MHSSADKRFEGSELRRVTKKAATRGRNVLPHPLLPVIGA
jgi:hypothetical protein